MPTELGELTNALMHQSNACYRIVEHKKRTHAFSIIQLLADIETGLATKKQEELAAHVEKMINTCTNCISTTAVAGKTYKCIKDETRKLKEDAGKISHVRWERITFEEEPKKYIKKR